jgi:hypothetical protein
LQLALGQRRKRCSGGRRDGIEDAKQGVRVAVRVAGDQFGVIEVVAGVHLNALVEPAAHGDLAVLVQKRDFTRRSWSPRH